MRVIRPLKKQIFFILAFLNSEGQNKNLIRQLIIMIDNQLDYIVLNNKKYFDSIDDTGQIIYPIDRYRIRFLTNISHQ